MPSPAEIAAYVGAAAWLPQIGAWIYRVLIRPVVRIIPERQVQIGYTTYGPIFNIRMAIAADRRDAVIEHLEVRLTHEQGDTHAFSWASFSETFSEISDTQGNRQKVERDQPAIALKVSTALLLDKFVRFQDAGYHDRHRAPIDSAVAHQTFLRANESDAAAVGRALLASKEFHALLEFYRSEFWWKPGRYNATFAIKSSNKARLERDSFRFILAQHDVDSLRKNVGLMDANYSNIVMAGTPGYEPKQVGWNWQTVPFMPTDGRG